MLLPPKVVVLSGRAGISNQVLIFGTWLASYGKRICLFATEQPRNLGWAWGTPANLFPGPIKASATLGRPSCQAPPFIDEKMDVQSREGLGPRPGLGFLSPQHTPPAHLPTPSSAHPKPKFTCLAILPSSAFLGKEKSSPGGRQASGQAAILIHQLPAALVTVV